MSDVAPSRRNRLACAAVALGSFALGAVVVVRAASVATVTVASGSMAPTLLRYWGAVPRANVLGRLAVVKRAP